MAIWLFRAGRSGEFEHKFLSEGKIYLTWDDLNIDLSKIEDRESLMQVLEEKYDEKKNTLRNWTGQIYPMAHRVQKGDWVVLPSKHKSVIHIGEVTGDYQFHPKAENPFYHSRNVNWFAQDIPRSNFEQDILYSLGAFMTVCQIKRNNAEERLKAMKDNNWHPKPIESLPTIQPSDPSDEAQSEDTSMVDLEEFANDQIAKLIIRKFKGHRMELLIEAILKAKGYITFHSPEGADKGIDILAAPAPMGFGSPRLCVQVKSTDGQTDRPTLDQLIGAVHNFGADQGLLVSWSGFKSSVERERPQQFFKVRLWGQKEILEEFLSNYDKLDDDIKAEIPLKRVWALSLGE
jgi:restriction system protein